MDEKEKKDRITALEGIAGAGNVRTGEALAGHTTFRVGGPADYYVSPASPQEVAALMAYAKQTALPYTVIGNGSNLLVSDDGYRGLVIHLGSRMSDTRLEGSRITAEAGITLAALALTAREASLTGLEFAAGIPGTLGGACLMNAGAYGGEMKQLLTGVTVATEAGDLKDYPAEALELGYRHSRLMATGEVVVSASLQLECGNPEKIGALMEELAGRRRDKQPLEYPSAGSTFKRPEGYFAGALIEEAGLKGRGVGRACVSEKHAGFVINRGGATAREIYETICMVRETVRERTGILLEPEVRLLGDFEQKG